jgi:hypothetical protein
MVATTVAVLATSPLLSPSTAAADPVAATAEVLFDVAGVEVRGFDD